MPTYKGINLILHSQYDAVTIPERSSPAPDNILIEIAVPNLPHSQFWLSYVCEPPRDDSFSFYFFKLFVQHRCVLSWGSGPNERWTGKTVFGFSDAGTDFEGRRVVAKSGFFFPAFSDGEGLEVRVFRARARKREVVRFGRLDEGGKGGLEMNRIGRLHRSDRQKMYSFALLDAKDEPFAVFRYHFCTDGVAPSIQASNTDETSGDSLSLDSRSDSTDDGAPEPPEDESTALATALDPSISTSPTPRVSPTLPSRKPLPSPPQASPDPQPRSPPRPATDASPSAHANPLPLLLHMNARNSPQGYRRPSMSAARSPSSTAIAERKHGLRTPSPPRGRLAASGSATIDVTPGTPPSQRKAATGGLLRGVVASALRRKDGGSRKVGTMGRVRW